MKKIFILGLFILACSTPVFAEEITLPKQTIQNENAFLGANLEKAPPQQSGQQLIKNNKSFLCINIIINGKVRKSNPSKE